MEVRLPIIAGNWKMNKTLNEGIDFINQIKENVKGTDVEVMLFVPYTLLGHLKKECDGSNIILGAQNIHFEEELFYENHSVQLEVK